MRQLIEYVKMAFYNIVSNKMRSLLTMLGIIIGIASVIIVVSIGSGGQNTIEEQLSGISNGSVYIFVNGEDVTDADMITEADIKAISEMPDVHAVSMEITMSASSIATREEVRTNITAGNQDYFNIVGKTLKYGRLWDASDYYSGRSVCVLDSAGAKELFGSDNVVGLTIEVTVQNKIIEYTIVGIVDSSPSMGKITAEINVPITSIQRVVDLGDSYGAVALIGKDPNQSAKLAEQALTLVELRHGNTGRESYMVYDISQFMSQINTVMGLFTTIIAAIAGISLLVGGIGVMNIMLVSVTERTREIGIRKALGAKTGTILFQFLIESASLTLFGGIIGIVLGALGGMALGGVMGITAEISPYASILIALFSSVIGVFFGIYPARKAAKMNPIEALRSE